jgi:hypothetical protein
MLLGGLGLMAAGLVLIAFGSFWLRRPKLVADTIQSLLNTMFGNRPPGGINTPVAGAIAFIVCGGGAIAIGVGTILRALS